MQDVCEIYALKDPETGSVRYIGKANDSAKRLKSHLRDSKRRKTPVYRWIQKLEKSGKTPSIEVLLVCEKAAWPEYETHLIAEYRAAGVALLNVADGGDEPSMSMEQRRENAKKVNASMIKTWRNCICMAGRQYKWALRVGNVRLAERFKGIQIKLRAMSQEERMEFAVRSHLKKASWALNEHG
jgi:hypothetical protein